MATSKKAKKPAAKKSEPKTTATGQSKAIDQTPIASVANMDNSFQVSEDQAGIGRFGRVTKGEHAGRYGVLEQAAGIDKDGFPTTVIFRTRDDNSERLVVNYDDIEPALAGGR